MPDKLTDNEIIKALECCGNQMYSCTDKQCKAKTIGNALDLINRQQAELKEYRQLKQQLADNLVNRIAKTLAEHLPQLNTERL